MLEIEVHKVWQRTSKNIQKEIERGNPYQKSLESVDEEVINDYEVNGQNGI